METEAVKVDVSASAIPQTPSLGFLSTVFISLSMEVEEFIVDESDGTFSSLRSYPNSSSSFPDPLMFQQFQNFTPNYTYQRLYNQFHDHNLCRLISDRIVIENQRSDLPQGPLFMMVSVKLTQKVYFVVPSGSDSSTPIESEVKESESCAVCLEDMSDWKTKPISQLPNCTHVFHEECVIKWLDGQHNSCPLCRQPVYGNE